MKERQMAPKKKETNTTLQQTEPARFTPRFTIVQHHISLPLNTTDVVHVRRTFDILM
jgi:hypothetical protein